MKCRSSNVRLNSLSSCLATLSSSVLIAALAAAGLAGCGKSEPKPPPKVEETVFGDLVATKERARVETEKAMEANKQKLEEAAKKIEESPKQ